MFFQQVEHTAGALGDRLGQRFHVTILQVEYTVGDIEDAVVVGYQYYRCALFSGQFLYQFNHVPAGLLIQ